MVETIQWVDGAVVMIDQTRLPLEETYVTCRTYEEVAAAIVKEGHEAMAIPCHIGRRADCEALIAKTRAKWGKIDTLVCNAAINPITGR